MGEIRQANFRIDQDTAEKFRKYCEEQRINQAEGFDKLMKAMFELNRASEVLPDRRAELERFGALTEKMMSAYLLSLEMADAAEERVRSSCASDLDQKEQQIFDLKEKNSELKARLEMAERSRAEAVKEAEQARKDAEAAERIRTAAEKTAEDKKVIAETLATKLAESEKKAEGFDGLRESLATARASLTESEQKAKDAARAAERERDSAVAAIREALEKKIRLFHEENLALKSSLDSARKDAETARVSAVAELSQSHMEEISLIRDKLDARTVELMAAREELVALRMENGVLKSRLEQAEREKKTQDP